MNESLPRGDNMDHALQQIAAALADLGLPAPANLIQTMLMKDGHFVGWKLRYDGGYAVLCADSGTMELFDDHGTSLKTGVVAAEQEAA
jgi:hypothetical protein